VSPPARGRGLKHNNENESGPSNESPPARGRGLKLDVESTIDRFIGSPPARGRGLKHVLPVCLHCKGGVAPRTGAWIETFDTAG